MHSNRLQLSEKLKTRTLKPGELLVSVIIGLFFVPGYLYCWLVRRIHWLHNTKAAAAMIASAPAAGTPVQNPPPPLRGRTEVGGTMNVNTTPHPNLPPQGGKESSFQSQLASLVTAATLLPSSLLAMRYQLSSSEFGIPSSTLRTPNSALNSLRTPHWLLEVGGAFPNNVSGYANDQAGLNIPGGQTLDLGFSGVGVRPMLEWMF